MKTAPLPRAGQFLFLNHSSYSFTRAVVTQAPCEARALSVEPVQVRDAKRRREGEGLPQTLLFTLEHDQLHAAVLGAVRFRDVRYERFVGTVALGRQAARSDAERLKTLGNGLG